MIVEVHITRRTERSESMSARRAFRRGRHVGHEFEKAHQRDRNEGEAEKAAGDVGQVFPNVG